MIGLVGLVGSQHGVQDGNSSACQGYERLLVAFSFAAFARVAHPGRPFVLRDPCTRQLIITPVHQ